MSLSDLSEVETTTNSGIAKNSAVAIKNA